MVPDASCRKKCAQYFLKTRCVHFFVPNFDRWCNFIFFYSTLFSAQVRKLKFREKLRHKQWVESFVLICGWRKSFCAESQQKLFSVSCVENLCAHFDVMIIHHFFTVSIYNVPNLMCSISCAERVFVLNYWYIIFSCTRIVDKSVFMHTNFEKNCLRVIWCT